MLDSALKQRLVGATVLVSLAVIFIPMLLDGTDPTETLILTSNIPDKPENNFKSRVVPLTAPTEKVEPAPSVPVDAPVEEPEKTTVPKIPAPLADADKAVRSAVTAWIVQLGSFTEEANAYQLQKQLRDKGFAAFVEPITKDSKLSYRVRVGPELTEKLADDLAGKIESQTKIKGIVVKYP